MSPLSVKNLQKRVKGRRVLVDSNVMIYLTDMVPPYHQLSRELFRMIEQGDVQAVFSIISISEVLNGPLRKGSASTAFEVRDYLLNFPNAMVQEIDREVINRIGMDEEITWSGLRTADSLIIACGLVNKVELFISNDLHFRTALPSDRILYFS
jgi:predicted nucleic acid-binding protein